MVGEQHGHLLPTFMIFKNRNLNYPIKGLGVDVLRVNYRSSPKGWINSYLFDEYFKCTREFVNHHVDGETKCVVYINNCSAHKLTDSVRCELQKKNVDLLFLPACATNLIQPLDSSQIGLFKRSE